MGQNNQDKTEKRRQQLKAVARYSGLGMEMAIAVLGAALLGRWLDERQGHEQPVLTLVLAFAGVFYVFYRLFKIASKQ